MSNELLINVTPSESRVALVENGQLQELYLERAGDLSLVGNIYIGTVERVLPGMQAAFVDIGLARTAFLHAGDLVRPEHNGQPAEHEQPPARVSIAEALREGQKLPVQVIKDPLGSKGARLSSQLSLPSRYLVFLPAGHGIGVSLRIDDDAERERLREMMQEMVGEAPDFGLIVRTNAEGMNADDCRRDLDYLKRLWSRIENRLAEGVPPGACLYEDLDLPTRALRDLMNGRIERVRVDDPATFDRIKVFAGAFVPGWFERLERYDGPGPLFDLYAVEDEITRALQRETPLKSGGYLIIDQTEAMTTVDVNTGGYVGHRNFEETIFKTNLEAAQAIARQLRLRNLGGIIIIDFIDMADDSHKRQVLRTLQQALARDPARTVVSEISEFGLVEMTRKRTTESLERRLCEPCPSCGGRGRQKSAETMCSEIFREIMRAVRQFDTGQLMVMAAPVVVEKILEEHTRTVAELTEQLGTSIRFQAEESYSREQFDVVLL